MDFVTSCGLRRDGSWYEIDHMQCNGWWQDINLVWEARVRQMWTDVKNGTKGSVFVEGIFMQNLEYEVFVLARLEGSGRYRVAESVWRIGCVRSLVLLTSESY